MPERGIYAHSLPGRPFAEWDLLSHHLKAVGQRAAEFARAFGWAGAASVAGRLHDIGKCSAEFQAYIAVERDDGGQARGPDHSTAGAREVALAYPGPLGKMLAYAIAGHHAGLADFDSLRRRQGSDYDVKPYPDWATHAGPLPAINELMGAPRRLGRDKGFTQTFLTRMIFSCLVDADFLETERFYAESNAEPIERGGHLDLGTLRERLTAHMAPIRANSGISPVNGLREEVLAHAISQAELPPGLFTLTVPTGGGKTLASLSFALEHALRHGLRRVVYVIPFTSIIEQTAQVFRRALRTNADILEHHSTFDWEQARNVAQADDEGPGGIVKLRRAAENWDAPIIVTTAVQFFESLFAARTSRCRKLHNLAGSVIILDEAQTLPIHLLRPCMAALDELARNYKASVVLCTATQPALGIRDDFQSGLELNEDRELAPDPANLHDRLKRVTVERLPEPVEDQVVTDRFVERPQMLCILNSRAHARAVYDGIRTLPGAVHLTTLMCPRHRRHILEDVRQKLGKSLPVRLVATSLIEAGVDIDFPEVWRAATGLDSIVQAAGRCNREGRSEQGRVVVFEPAHAKPPRDLAAFWQAARPVLRRHIGDPLSPDAVTEYFKELYWQKGDDALDAARLNGRPWPILKAIAERAPEFDFEFAKIAEAFRMIEDNMIPVIVPWRADEDDHDADKLLSRIAAMERPFAADLRRLQQYVVSIPLSSRDSWLAAGVLIPVHPRLGVGLLRFVDLAHYDSRTGVDLSTPLYRTAEENVW